MPNIQQENKKLVHVGNSDVKTIDIDEIEDDTELDNTAEFLLLESCHTFENKNKHKKFKITTSKLNREKLSYVNFWLQSMHNDNQKDVATQTDTDLYETDLCVKKPKLVDCNETYNNSEQNLSTFCLEGINNELKNISKQIVIQPRGNIQELEEYMQKKVNTHKLVIQKLQDRKRKREYDNFVRQKNQSLLQEELKKLSLK